MGVAKFAEQSSAATKFITDLYDFAWRNNASSDIIENAAQLLIAIENAKNIFKDCTSDKKALLDAKVLEFDNMIACVEKTDYSRLNLPHRIRHSIDTGTSDGWIPKLYAVNPQHVVPTKEFTVQFFGKFKYADQAKYMPSLMVSNHKFTLIASDHHTLTFKGSLPAEEAPFNADKCSLLFGKLVVPYEAGTFVGAKKEFEFNVPIRVLPTTAGTLGIEKVNGNVEVVKMEWGKMLPFGLSSDKTSQISFASFDGIKHVFRIEDLEKEAEKTLTFVKHATYLSISVGTRAERGFYWHITVVPPVDL